MNWIINQGQGQARSCTCKCCCCCCSPSRKTRVFPDLPSWDAGGDGVITQEHQTQHIWPNAWTEPVIIRRSKPSHPHPSAAVGWGHSPCPAPWSAQPSSFHSLLSHWEFPAAFFQGGLPEQFSLAAAVPLFSLTCQLNPAGSQTNTENNPVPLTTHPILPQAQETLYSSFQCISKKDVFWLYFSKIFSNPFKIYKVINKINIWKWQYFVATSITFK